MKLGKMHWYLLRALQEMDKNEYIKKESGPGEPVSQELTPFGLEVGPDEIHWWVFKKEKTIDQLEEKTKKILITTQKLKESSQLLASKLIPKSYKELIEGLSNFSIQNEQEIHDLLEFVKWLNSKSLYAPIVLFSPRAWSTTRRSNKIAEAPETVNEDTIKKYVEIVYAVRNRFGYVIDQVYSEIASERHEYLTDQGNPPTHVTIPKKDLLDRTSREVLKEFASYFEQIRNSLKQILTEIEKCKDEVRLLYNEHFWVKFVIKAMSECRVENQLWDFKKSLEIWHLSDRNENQKASTKVDFSQHIAGYANSNGGVLIIGITDAFPRKAIGLTDLENKINTTRDILGKYLQSSVPLHYQQIKLKNESNQDCDCLIIAIAQTKYPVEVKNQQDWSSYPKRIGAGKTIGDVEEIRLAKSIIVRDNYNYLLSAIDAFVNGK